jgi:hypothetical protein
MATPSRVMKILLISAAVVGFLFAGAVPTLHGQRGRPVGRIIRGSVVDKKGNPVVRAVVYLKGARARTLKMKTTDRDGSFNFGWVESRVDQEVYAEARDAASQRVIISALDDRQEVILKLKLQDVDNTTSKSAPDK